MTALSRPARVATRGSPRCRNVTTADDGAFARTPKNDGAATRRSGLSTFLTCLRHQKWQIPEPRSGSPSIARGERSEPRVPSHAPFHHGVVAHCKGGVVLLGPPRRGGKIFARLPGV